MKVLIFLMNNSILSAIFGACFFYIMIWIAELSNTIFLVLFFTYLIGVILGSFESNILHQIVSNYNDKIDKKTKVNHSEND